MCLVLCVKPLIKWVACVHFSKVSNIQLLTINSVLLITICIVVGEGLAKHFMNIAVSLILLKTGRRQRWGTPAGAQSTWLQPTLQWRTRATSSSPTAVHRRTT